jgi:hypothetical protein
VRIPYQFHWAFNLGIVAAASLLFYCANPKFKPSIAIGAKVTTSSLVAPFKNADGAVDQAIFTPGFCTREENEPWLLIDLGVPKTISRVVVYNRETERAIPWVVEVSKTGSAFLEVAHIDQAFSIWDHPFPPTEARFVRLRLRANTHLILNEVEIF